VPIAVSVKDTLNRLIDYGEAFSIYKPPNNANSSNTLASSLKIFGFPKGILLKPEL